MPRGKLLWLIDKALIDDFDRGGCLAILLLPFVLLLMPISQLIAAIRRLIPFA